MKSTELVLVAVLILAAGGLVLGFLLAGGGESPSNLPLTGAPEQPGAREEPREKPEVEKGEAVEPPTRIGESGPTRVMGGEGPKGARQVERGVKGIVLDPAGAPLAGAKVYLAQTFDVKNFFQAMALTRRMPVRDFRSSETDEQGTFLVGFGGDKLEADLFVSHPGYQRAVQKKVLVPAKGVNALEQPIRMKPGFTVQGTVTSQVSNAPIPGATVRLTYQGTNVFESVPGEEDGIVARTDDMGRYRFTTLPPGNHNFEAYAKGHAKQTQVNQAVNASTGALILDFNLPGGSSIAGMVVDGQGTPVGGAKIEAIAHSNKTPCTADARSARDGSFEVLGLPAGAYRLTASHAGFVDGVKNMARTGEDQVALVLQRKGKVVVRVLGRNGRPLRSFFLELRSVMEGQSMYGRTEVPAKQVRNARGGIYELTGVGPGNTYALRVEHKNYAMTFSEPFQVELGREPPQVTVRMKEGGRIQGRVVDATGSPVAGAVVQSMNPQYQDNPFLDIFGLLVPVSHSRVSARTDRSGEFTLRRIMPTTYQIKVTHPSHPKTYKKPIEVTEGQTTEAGDLVLPVGVIAHGTAYDEKGRPIPLAKVSMRGEGGQQYGGETKADEKGEFHFPPAPPGRYKLQCARPNVGPFHILVDYKKSETPVNLTGAEKRVKVDLQIK